MQALGMVALRVGGDFGLVAVQRVHLVAGGEFGGNDHLIAHTTTLEPLAEPLLALFVLVVVRPALIRPR